MSNLSTLDDGTYRLNPDGSFTPEIRSTGYWVAVREIHDHDDIMLGSGEFIGSWREPHTDRLYLDASVWVECRSCAIDLGRDHKQVAIWDCANNDIIDLTDNN